MAKIRINELARELEVKSHSVLEYLADPAALTSTVLRELSKVPPGTSAPAVCGTPLTIPGKRS